MAIRDRWKRMLHKSASSAPAAPSPGTGWHVAFPGSSSSPTSPSGGVTVTSYTWSTSSESTTSHPPSQQQQQHHQKQEPQPQQQLQQPQQQRPKPKRRSKKSSCHHYCSTASRPYPSERPLTDENLRHQEMFANFTLTFGRSGSGSSASSSSPSGRCSLDDDDGGGISPCSSRRGSLADPRAAALPRPFSVAS